MVGIDHDEARVELARRAALRVPATARPVFESGDLRQKLESFTSGSLAGIAMIDILHYFDAEGQRCLIIEASRVLVRGGILVVREIDADAGFRSRVNRFYERLATGVGFTRSVNTTLVFRGAREWIGLMEKTGFNVRSERSGPPFFADVLFVAERR